MAMRLSVSVFLLINILQLNALPTFRYNETREDFVSQTVGQPWPMPASYSSNSDLYSIDSELFEFTATGQSCDVLYEAFARYRRILFGQNLEVLKFKPHLGESHQTLYVNQRKPCDKYPSLESDESCKYTISIIL